MIEGGGGKRNEGKRYFKTLNKETLEPNSCEHSDQILNATGDGVVIEIFSAVDAVWHSLDV